MQIKLGFFDILFRDKKNWYISLFPLRINLFSGDFLLITRNGGRVSISDFLYVFYFIERIRHWA